MTLSEARDKMRSIANVDENRLPDDEANNFLQIAEDEIATAYRLRMHEAFIVTAFVEDVATINPAPTEGVVMYPTRLFYADSTGAQVTVIPQSWEVYLQNYGIASQSDGTGDPERFAVFGEDDNGNPTFWLGPVPDADKTVYLSARIRFVIDTTDDSYDDPVLRQIPMALVYRALVDASSFLEQPERATEWQGLYTQTIKHKALADAGARYSAQHANQMQEPG